MADDLDTYKAQLAEVDQLLALAPDDADAIELKQTLLHLMASVQPPTSSQSSESTAAKVPVNAVVAVEGEKKPRPVYQIGQHAIAKYKVDGRHYTCLITEKCGRFAVQI
eukprot:ANDGO_03843.mRNA.1 hypothetical protein